MRRSHPGIGGWRNENPRHFRPRNGGNQHYRPSRPYGILDTPRFPPPGSRPHRNSHSYKQRLGNDDHHPHDRTKFRSDYNRHHSYQRNLESHNHQEKQTYPLLPMRQSEPVYSNTYKKSSMYYEESGHCHMNKMGDIDHRLIPPNREPVRRHVILPWSHDNNVQHYDNRSHKYDQNKSAKYDSGESSKLPVYDNTGHRPPSSDHYVGNSTPAVNNSDSFSRSVDDTVNIVRRRLQNRNEPHHHSSDLNYSHSSAKIQATPEKPKETVSLPNFHQQEQTNKKRVQTQRQSEKIKSKIVNQLFKMDKEKIHKLMDNPNSSSKFEYAISSLITESQYSFNRHLRSVAEKSLHASSSMDFIQNDNNTIYEDTFMKQMQCILDPQDTIILEDIKPIVMAELSKVLQLDEYEQRFERGDNEVNYQQSYDQPDYSNEYSDTSYNYNAYPQNTSYEEPNSPSLTHINYRNPENPETNIENVDYGRSNEKQYKNSENQYQNTENQYTESFLERRPRTKSCNFGESGVSVSDVRRYLRRSLDVRPTEEPMNFSASPDRDPPLFDLHTDVKPLFNSNVEQLSEEEDPFAELDRQYHVAVDPAFIQNDDSSSLHLDKDSNPPSSSNLCKDTLLNIKTPEREFDNIKQEIECQLQDIADSSLNFPSCTYQPEGDVLDTTKKVPDVIKQEPKDLCIEISSHTVDTFDREKYTSNVNHGESAKFENKATNNETEQSDNSRLLTKTAGTSVSRKRSIDQSPSHRKEKRKKVSSEQLDNKEVRNKNIDINAKECASKSEKTDAIKSVITLFFSKQEDEHTDKAISKDTKTDNKKSDTNKHTKRKQSQKASKQKDNETFRKQNSTESLNSSLSPKETKNLVSSNKLNIKQESKTTLKTIDIFTEQPKKINLHHAHRNTALPISSNKIVTDFKNKQVTYKPNAKHASVQVIMKKHSKEIQTESETMCSRFSQTEKKKYVARGVQTDSVPTIKSTFKSNDSFERMKEIDLEIQVLLQEKFKLYSSIESKESGQNSLHTLGMTVLDVSPFEEEGKDQPAEVVLCEDSVVEDFTNIPVEELEQIALETVEETPVSTSRPERRNRRLKAVDQCSSNSQSPVPATPKRSCRKIKAPNISLIEQIISDDRPIEEIISFDDLENTPSKPENKTLRPKRTSKRRGIAKAKATSPSPSSNDSCSLKPCTVLVVREDFTKYLPSQEGFQDDSTCIDEAAAPIGQLENNVAEVPITSDIQFDMLDFSEDIVIGDNCEVKSVEDKEISESTDVNISEEVILDNSQSSIEEQVGTSSSQKEDECKMYDYSADENLRRDSIVVTGNADAVLAIECIEKNFIAACLDGNVYYFSGDGQLITTLRGSNLAVTCLTIVKEKYGTTVYTGSLDSRIRYYDLDTGLEKGPECNVLSPIQTMDRAWDTVFVGTRTGFVLQFECKNNMLIPVSTVQFSDQSILALRAMKEGPRKVLLVAARSEDVTIKDAQTGLLLRTLAGPKMTVYTLLYEDGKIYCGTSSSQIHVFDYSSGTHVGAHEGGKGAVCLRAAGGLLFAGCYDGCVYVYREGERRPFAQLRGPGLMLLSLAIIDTKIIAGYKDRSLYIWKIPFSILQEMIL